MKIDKRSKIFIAGHKGIGWVSNYLGYLENKGYKNIITT
jgi:hypothetical protein